MLNIMYVEVISCKLVDIFIINIWFMVNDRVTYEMYVRLCHGQASSLVNIKAKMTVNGGSRP